MSGGTLEPEAAARGKAGRGMLAERVRFELTGLSSSGFQDRRNRPLCHLSVALFALDVARAVRVGGYPNLPKRTG